MSDLLAAGSPAGGCWGSSPLLLLMQRRLERQCGMAVGEHDCIWNRDLITCEPAVFAAYIVAYTQCDLCDDIWRIRSALEGDSDPARLFIRSALDTSWSCAPV